MNALELERVSASYGRFRALFDVSLVVGEGEVVALIGPNGAGKSTIARVTTGLVPSTGGRLRVAGHDVTGWQPYRIARLGVTHVPEGRSVFATLDVEDNLLLHFSRGVSRKETAAALERAYASFPRLAERRHQIAGTLSGGEQRMLVLAGALARPPKLLVADELSLGLAPRVVGEVFAALDNIRRAGTSILLIEQHVARAVELADRYLVLRKGEVVRDGPATELDGVPDLSRLVLSRSGKPAELVDPLAEAIDPCSEAG